MSKKEGSANTEDGTRNTAKSRISMDTEDIFYSEMPSPGSRPARPEPLTPTPPLPMQKTQSGSAEEEGGYKTGLKRRSLSMQPKCENTSPKQLSQRARSVSSGMANQSKSSDRFEIPSFFQQKKIVNMNLQTTLKILCNFHSTIFMTQDDSFVRDLALRTVLRGEEIVPSSDLMHLIDNLLLSIFHLSRSNQSRRCESSVEMWKIMDSFEMMPSKFGFSMTTSVKKSWDQLRMEAIRSQMYVPGNELIEDIKYH